MSFVDELDLKILKKLKLKVRCKETGEIYPVKRIEMWDSGAWEAIYRTSEEQIKEHRAKGGHYCSSCGDVFYDEFFTEKTGELIVECFETY